MGPLRELLPRIAWDRPVMVSVAFVALLVLSLLAWARIPIQMWPSGFEPSFLWVWVPYPNASPREVDDAVVRVVEEELSTVSGIKSLNSHAESDGASFEVEFYGSLDMDVGYNAVVDRMERAMANLPDDVERYFVYKFNPDDQPVMWVGVSLPDTVTDPHHVLTRVVQPRLERVNGVAALDVWGVDQRQIYVDWRRDALLAHGVNLGEVQGRLREDNFQMAGGRIEEDGQVRYVRSLSRLDDLEALAEYPVKDGVTLDDIADISMRSVREASINRIDGKDAASFAIRKDSSANAVAVCDAVEAELRLLERDPRLGGARFFTFFSQGDMIQESMNNLLTSTMVGGAFAVVILYLFLREWRMTLLISAAIPFSLALTVAVLYFGGESLNLLSLMGLMLAVGMVVDNAIVVVETIYRYRADGGSLRDATIAGTGEVNLAILASTGTTMVVFLPIILMTQDATFSFFLRVLGMPVVWALAASVLVALVFAPFATRFIRRSDVRPDPGWLVRLAGLHGRLLRFTLTRRSDAAAAFLALSFLTIIPMTSVECAGEPDGNLNDFTVRFSVPREATMPERDAVVRRLEETVEAHRDEWGVRVYRVRLPSDGNSGSLYVYLDSDGPMTREEVMEQAKGELPDDLPGVKATIGWDESSMAGGDKVAVEVHGEDMVILDGLAEEVARRMETVPGVLSARSSQEASGKDEIRLAVDRAATARYGLDAMTVAQTVAWAMRGEQLEPIVEGEREVDVITRFALQDRQSIETLRAFPVWSTAMMGVVPLRALTDVEVGRGPASIHRTNRRTGLTVEADLVTGSIPTDVWMGVDAALADMQLPHGYSWSRGQSFQFEMQEDEAQQLALLLSIAFVFLLMGVLFESIVLPLAVITTVPMAVAGAFWGLWLTDTSMDTMAGVGLIVLVGVVVNNGIVLVDIVGQLRSEGLERTDALVEAGRRRLRPILMTALTTICGLMPMAVGSASFIGIPYAPLGRVVIGGMVASTLLTLVFVPFAYAVLDDVRNAGVRWVRLVLSLQETR